MKKISKWLLFFLVIACYINTPLLGQEKIKFGKDQCTHCNMIVRDNLHVAIAIDKNGNDFKFDAIECMINFLKEKEVVRFEKLLVADYGDKGNLVDATKAIYLKTKEIPSPMGAFLSAFRDRNSAEKVLLEKGGEIFDWNEIVQKFNDSGFGLKIHQHFRPDAYAPIGVMGDHLHHKGGFMMSLRYMNMNMAGNKTGIHSIESDDILNEYMVSPENMNMQMYMLGVMYAPDDQLTVMVMQSYLVKNMDMVNRMGNNFSTDASGFGDMKLSALYQLVSKNQFSFHLNAGLSIPIGSTGEKDDTPMANDVRLPYAMQLGSGTFDFLIGGTFKGHGEKLSWGVQQINLIRTGTNPEGYRFGNQFELNSWGAVKVLDWMSFSLRLQGSIQNGMVGIDQDLNSMMAPATNTTNYGYEKVNAFLGTNISFSQYSIFKRIKFGFEAGLPIFENYNGIQMDEGSTLIVGLRYTSL